MVFLPKEHQRKGKGTRQAGDWVCLAWPVCNAGARVRFRVGPTCYVHHRLQVGASLEGNEDA